MKLHLPKSLSVALLTVICCVAPMAGAAIQSETIGSGDEAYTKYTMGANSSSYTKEYTEKELVMDGDDTLGIYKNGDLIIDDFGIFENGSVSEKSNGVTNTLVVGKVKTGLFGIKTDDLQALTMSGNAKIALGGQHGSYYAGIKAAAASISGNAELIAGSAQFSSLSVSGTADVTLHGINAMTEKIGAAEYTGGNNWSNVLGGWVSPNVSVAADPGHKMTIISGSLSVADSAQVTIGVDNGQYGTYKTSHYLTSLYGTITQDTSSDEGAAKSSLAIKGKTYISDTLNLTQNGGTMEMGLKADSSGTQKALVYLSSSKNNKITQNGAGTLTVGRLVKGIDSAENSQIIISQTGSGILNMDNGVDFTSNSKYTSSITQSGSGIINLYGDFTSADFTVNQTNGTINLYGKMDLVGTENSFGKNFDVESGAELTASSLSVGGKLTNDGTLTTSGKMTASGTVDNNKNMVVQALEITGGTTTNAKDATLTAGSITVNGGTFVNYGNITSEKPSMLMAAEAEALAEANQVGLITIASGKMEQYGTTTSNILVQAGGTLTLGVVDNQTVTTAVGAVTLEAGANMVVADDSETGALTLKGGTITFMEGATLDSTSVSGLETVTITLKVSADTFADVVDGNGYAETLFTVADTSALDNTTIFVATEGKDAQQVQVKQDAAGNVTVGQLVPEPTTATLSLLALAALAARRRRK